MEPDVINDLIHDGSSISKLKSYVEENKNYISPQMLRRFAQFFNHISNGDHKLNHIIDSIVQRLTFELIQAHYNTKQREQNFVRLMDKLGCSIKEPKLTNIVIECLVNLFSAADQNSDSSFERNILVKYLMKNVEQAGFTKRQVEKVLQTIYRCSCFDIKRGDNSPSRLSLKPELNTFQKLRTKYETELIRLARDNCIFLGLDSWTYLLLRDSTSQTQAQLQSLIDREKSAVNLEDLETVIRENNDKLNLSEFLPILHRLRSSLQSDKLEYNTLVALLNELIPLLTFRQTRNIYQ